MSAAEQITDPCTQHGEGPFWDAARGRLLFVDMLRGAIVALDHAGRVERYELGGVAAALRSRREGGGLVLATERGFRLLSSDLTFEDDEIPAFEDPAVRMNDGGCDPQGRFYCGTMAYAETPGAGTLFRLDPDHSVHRVLTGVTISNGLQWHADGKHAYYVDTPTGRVDLYEFDPDTGHFGARTTFAALEPGAGLPDGIALDEQGGVWVALWGGAAVHRYDEAGRLCERVELPAKQVTACAFGGVDYSTLFITTSREGLDGEAEREAGAVFAVEAGIRGATLHQFAG